MRKETKGKSKLRNENCKNGTDGKHTHTKNKGLDAISNQKTISETKKKSLDMLTGRMGTVRANSRRW